MSQTLLGGPPGIQDPGEARVAPGRLPPHLLKGPEPTFRVEAPIFSGLVGCVVGRISADRPANAVRIRAQVRVYERPGSQHAVLIKP